MAKEEAKNEKRGVFRICWADDGHECEKGAFSEYVSQLMTKDTDGQEIHEVTREVKYWSHDRHMRVFPGCDHRVSTNLAAVLHW